MLDTARRLGLHLHIQLNSLYTIQAQAAKQWIEDGYLGKPFHARSYGFRRRGRPFVDGFGEKEFNSKYWAAGGALFDMGVYHISLLLYLLGNPEVNRVSGAVYQEMDMYEDRRNEAGFDVEELGCGFVKFKGGLTMDILEAWAIHGRAFPPSMIAGDKGGVSIWSEDFSAPKGDSLVEFFGEMSGYPITSSPELWMENFRSRSAHPELAKRDASQAWWAAVIRGEEDTIKTAEIALNTMLISEGIFQSSAIGREVSAEEIISNSKSLAIRRQETGFGVLEY